MNDSNQSEYQRHRSTRRSFIKKSIVASIAASNVTMFSGLVDASEFAASTYKKKATCHKVGFCGTGAGTKSCIGEWKDSNGNSWSGNVCVATCANGKVTC